MTRNQKLHVLHVDSATSFAKSQILQYVRGDTLLFDFVYFLHPVGPPSASIVLAGHDGMLVSAHLQMALLQ